MKILENEFSSTIVPTDYLEFALLQGSGKLGGKQRIIDLFKEHSLAEKRIESIKREYYYSGQNVPIKWNGYAGYAASPECYKIFWMDHGIKKVCIMTWNIVLKHIEQLITIGKYEGGMTST